MIVPIRAALPLDAVVAVRLTLTGLTLRASVRRRKPAAGIVLGHGRHGHEARCDVTGDRGWVMQRVRVARS